MDVSVSGSGHRLSAALGVASKGPQGSSKGEPAKNVIMRLEAERDAKLSDIQNRYSQDIANRQILKDASELAGGKGGGSASRDSVENLNRRRDSEINVVRGLYDTTIQFWKEKAQEEAQTNKQELKDTEEPTKSAPRTTLEGYAKTLYDNNKTNESPRRTDDPIKLLDQRISYLESLPPSEKTDAMLNILRAERKNLENFRKTMEPVLREDLKSQSSVFKDMNDLARGI